MVAVLDFMWVHHLHCEMLNGVKMLWFLELMIVPVHPDNRKNYNLVLVEGPTDGLVDTTIKAFLSQ